MVCFAIATLQYVPHDVISCEICGEVMLIFDEDATFTKLLLAAIVIGVVDTVGVGSVGVSNCFESSTMSEERSDDDIKKLCSVSSNDADAEDMTPDNNCIEGASGSLSELSASVVCSFSVFHHGDWQPSDAVR